MKKLYFFTILFCTALLLHSQWNVSVHIGGTVGIIKNNGYFNPQKDRIQGPEHTNYFTRATTVTSYDTSFVHTLDSTKMNVFGHIYCTADLTRRWKHTFLSHSFSFQTHKDAENNHYISERLYYHNYNLKEIYYYRFTTLSYALVFGYSFKTPVINIEPFLGLRIYGLIYSFQINEFYQLYTSWSYKKSNKHDIILYPLPALGIQFNKKINDKWAYSAKFTWLYYWNLQWGPEYLENFYIAYGVFNLETKDVHMANDGTITSSTKISKDSYSETFYFSEHHIGIELGLTYSLGRKKQKSIAVQEKN
jgi:hypothetical protein